MTNHPNRSKHQHTMTQTAKHTPLIESLLEAVFIGRTMRPVDKAMVREALRLQRANTELLAALKGAEQIIAVCDGDWEKPLAQIRAAIAKAEGR